MHLMWMTMMLLSPCDHISLVGKNYFSIELHHQYWITSSVLNYINVHPSQWLPRLAFLLYTCMHLYMLLGKVTSFPCTPHEWSTLSCAQSVLIFIGCFHEALPIPIQCNAYSRKHWLHGKCCKQSGKRVWMSTSSACYIIGNVILEHHFHAFS